MNEAIAARLDGWSAAADSGQEIDVYAEMKRLTRDIVLRTMFSASLGPDEAARVDAAIETMVDGLSALMWLGFLPSFVPNPAKARVLRAVKVIDDVLYRIVHERQVAAASPASAEAPPQMPDDLLSMLLAARDADTGEGMTPAQLRDEVMGMFVASYEATALALTWTFYALTQHPEVRARLQGDVDALGGRPPGAHDLPALGYARMVFEESMRFYPPGWVIPRQAMADDVIGGYRIPANAILLLCNYITHRRPEHWARPGEFSPDHFLPERVAERPRYAFLAFGGGPRQCIGNTFAMMEAQLILTGLLQRYEIELARPVVPRASHVMLRPDPTLSLKLRRRAG
jgi:cytochrome P450